MQRHRSEESLEALEERVERARARREEDREVELEDLIEAMVPPERVPIPAAPAELTGEEFTCSACRLIRPRRCLADEERMMCTECIREDQHAPRPVVRRRLTIEAPCPACGTTVMVPERDDAACGFFCPECGAHVMRRGGHLHLFWNHRYRPDHLPPRRHAAGTES